MPSGGQITQGKLAKKNRVKTAIEADAGAIGAKMVFLPAMQAQ
jgi:hypothetical protein